MFILTLLEHFIGTLLPLCIDSLWLYLFDWVTYWENVKHVYCQVVSILNSEILMNSRFADVIKILKQLETENRDIWMQTWN